MINIDFYNIAHQILGELPPSSAYLYDFLTIIIIILSLFIVIFPIGRILKNSRF